jgi:hypothetical protein
MWDNFGLPAFALRKTPVKKLLSLAAAFAASLLLSACGSSQGSAAGPPSDFRIQVGDSSVTATWTAEPDVTYWLFYGPGPNITTSNWVTSGGKVLTNVTSPQIITGFINGVTYSFTINGRKNGGPGGEGAPTQVAVPRLAGNNWTVGETLGTGKLYGVASGPLLGGYATVSVGEGGVIYQTIGGSATATATNPAAPNDLYSVAFGVAGFVAVGANGTIIQSGDTVSWSARFSGTSQPLYAVAPTTGGYIAVGGGGTILTSPDAQTWTVQASGTTADLFATVGGLDYQAAAGAGGTIVTSGDGATWATRASGTTAKLTGITIGSFTSTDGTTTTNVYAATGAGGALTTSTDGLAWTARPSIGTANLAALRFGGQFVAVGAGGVIYTSPDGTTWTSQVSGTTNDLLAITRTLTGYTVTGARGTTLFSS